MMVNILSEPRMLRQTTKVVWQGLRRGGRAGVGRCRRQMHIPAWNVGHKGAYV
jgi:hypothetical protein